MPKTSTPITALAHVDVHEDANWLALALEAVEHHGCCVVSNAVDGAMIDRVATGLARAQEAIHSEIGAERLARAGELGVLRAPMKYSPEFLELLNHPALLAIVDAIVSDTAILHLQNGFVLPPQDAVQVDRSFQQSFHMDFPRYMNGYVASVNVLLAVDEFTADNGGTLVSVGTHQRAAPPAHDYLARTAVPIECASGSLIVFDSTLWHAAGRNLSQQVRRAVNHQFTRSFIKQQIDYVRCLGDDALLALPPRTQQLLGWYTRVVTSLDEYYRPANQRLYRSGQG